MTMPDPRLVRHVRSDLTSQRDLVTGPVRDMAEAVARRCGRPMSTREAYALADSVARSHSTLAAGAESMDVYAIDTDVIRIAMDVVCSTGVLPEWLDLVPESGIFVWDAHDLARDAPFICAAVGMGQAGPAGTFIDDIVEFCPSGFAMTGRGRVAWPIAASDLEGMAYLGADEAGAPLEEGAHEVGFHGVARRLVGVALLNAVRDRVMADPVWVAGLASEGAGALADSLSAAVADWVETGGAARQTASALDAHGLDGHQALDMLPGVESEHDGPPRRRYGRTTSVSAMTLLSAVFALRAHPELVGERCEGDAPYVSRGRRRRLERDGVDVSALARRTTTTIHLRERPEAPRTGDSTPVDYSCRWIVHGHFTHQPCGPNRSERRLTWIAPYVKGPAGKPLKSDLARDVGIRL